MADADRAQHSSPAISNWASSITLVMVLGMAAALAWHSLTDLDIWFHLRAGQDLLDGGGFSQVNGYSFADPNHPWLNHEWLFQILAAWTAPLNPLANDAASGWNALRFLLILALAGLLLLGDGNGRRLRSGSDSLAASLAATAVLAGLFLMWPRFNLRPELLSYIFFVMLVRGADSHYRRSAPSIWWQDTSLWRLFVVILVWAQCHGFAAIGPLVLLLAVLLRPLDRNTSRAGWRPLVLWAPVWLGLVALVLTPNLWRGLIFPFRALGQLTAETADLSQTVSELVPLLATRNSLHLTLIVFKLSLVWGVVFTVLGWGRISVLRAFLFALAAWAAFGSQRNIGLYGVAFVLLHTGLDGEWPGPWCSRWLKLPRLSARSRMGAVVGVAVLVAGIVAWWVPQVASNDFYLREGVGRRFGNGSTPATYPRQAATVLNRIRAPRTFANLDSAAFLLGTTQAPLFVDGRTEAYPKARWAEYARIRDSGPPALNLLRKNDISTVVLALSSGAFGDLASNLMASNGWYPAAADAGGVLFRAQSPQDAQETGDILSSSAESLLVQPVADPTRRADDCLAAAELFQLADNPGAARRALAAGLDARPDHPNLNHNLGNLKLAEGDFSGALPHFQRAMAVNGRLAGSALNAGVCQLRLRQPEAAVASFERALGIDPDQVGAWVNLAVAQRGLGQHDEAIASLEKALALQPGNARLQGQLQQWRNATR